MANKTVLYIATSLDGFIADEKGSINFLNEIDQDPKDDCGYGKFMNDTEVIIMGSKTYLQITKELAVDEWPYAGKKCYVFTSQDLPKDKNVTFKNESIVNFIHQIRFDITGNIWICGGADIINQLLDENLIDEYHIFTMPVILGKGIKLFNAKEKLPLKLLKTTKHGQIVGSIYKPKS